MFPHLTFTKNVNKSIIISLVPDLRRMNRLNNLFKTVKLRRGQAGV